MPLTYSYFGVFTDGNTRHYASPDPPTPEEARPFVVSLRTDNPGGTNVIPLNVLVFARDEEHARSRVVQALEECCTKDYKGPGGVDIGRRHVVGRQYELLRKYRKGEYVLLCQPLDINLMPGIEWATNGGL